MKIRETMKILQGLSKYVKNKHLDIGTCDFVIESNNRIYNDFGIYYSEIDNKICVKWKLKK